MESKTKDFHVVVPFSGSIHITCKGFEDADLACEAAQDWIIRHPRKADSILLENIEGETGLVVQSVNFTPDVVIGEDQEDVGTPLQAACKFIERRHKWEILEYKYSCSDGNIDIVAIEEREETPILHMIEVITRESYGDGFVDTPTSKSKRLRLEKIAESYILSKKSLPECQITFDEIQINVLGDGIGILRFHTNILSSGAA